MVAKSFSTRTIHMLLGRAGRRKIARLTMILAVSWLLGGQAAYAESLALEEVVQLVRDEIALAQKSASGSPRVRIDKIKLEISVMTKVSGGLDASFEVPILNLGELGIEGGLKESRRSVLVMELVPVDKPAISTAPSLGLANVVQSIRRAYQLGANAEGTQFRYGKITFKSGFEFVESGEAGLKVIFVGGSLAATKIASNAIEFTMTLLEEANNGN